MKILKRLIGKPDPREAWRPLWHNIVATSREKEWYANCGVADSLEGRFDMISLVLSLAMLRMEGSEKLAPSAAFVTELFVADMDRQLRDSGVGDLMVGKNIGKMVSALGGRMGAVRETLPMGDKVLAETLQRNITLNEKQVRLPFHFAVRIRALHNELAALSDADIMDGQMRAGGIVI